MKRLLYLLIAPLVVATASAQVDSLRVDSLRIAPSAELAQSTPTDTVRLTLTERLGRPMQVDSLTTINATVRFEMRGDAEHIINSGLSNKTTNSINGYRIVIFMSNSQSARRDAFAMQDSFKALYPTEKTYVSYENPYFKVMVGNYSSKEEAIIYLGSIRRSFPKAFIMRESIPIEEFAK
ncbi:MAG: SPOR domain-containing protein [Alistipes sp.]|nr:SPOR domain-containing protein [Alistipes sp.]